MEGNLPTVNYVDFFPQSDRLGIIMLQVETLDNSPDANKAHIEELISSANFPTKTHLIILPEMFTTGYTVDTAQAEVGKSQSLQWMLQMAERAKAVVVGSILLKEGEKFYNRLFVAYPDGKTHLSYDKQKLFPPAKEDIYLTAGQNTLQIPIAGWQVKFLICYELRFPELSTNRTSPADALIYIANWPAERIAIWDSLLEARAIENQCFSIGVNRMGVCNKGIKYPGHSAIYNPVGEMLCCNAQRGVEQILNFTISKDEISAQRAFLPIQ